MTMEITLVQCIDEVTSVCVGADDVQLLTASDETKVWHLFE